MIYALGWIVMIASFGFCPMFIVMLPVVLTPILLPASRLLPILGPKVSLDTREVRQIATGQVICIWVATLALTATPRDGNEVFAVAFLVYIFAGLCSAWRVKVPLKRLPSQKWLFASGLASQSLWFVFSDNIVDNLNGLFS